MRWARCPSVSATTVTASSELRKAFFAGLAQSSMEPGDMVELAIASNDPGIITAFTKELVDAGNHVALKHMMARLMSSQQPDPKPIQVEGPASEAKRPSFLPIPEDWDIKGHPIAGIFDGFHEDLDQPYSTTDSTTVGKRLAKAFQALGPGEALTTHQIHRAGLGFAELPKDRPELRHTIRNGRARANEILEEEKLTTQAVQVHGRMYAYYLREVGT